MNFNCLCQTNMLIYYCFKKLIINLSYQFALICVSDIPTIYCQLIFRRRTSNCLATCGCSSHTYLFCTSSKFHSYVTSGIANPNDDNSLVFKSCVILIVVCVHLRTLQIREPIFVHYSKKHSINNAQFSPLLDKVRSRN